MGTTGPASGGQSHLLDGLGGREGGGLLALFLLWELNHDGERLTAEVK